jgi:hypothetical protein
VADDGAAVCRLANVELKAVAAMSEGEIERLDSVFRNGAGGAGTTMTEQERARHMLRF